MLTGGLGTGRIVSYELGARTRRIIILDMRPVTCTFVGATAPVTACVGAASVTVTGIGETD